jgi:hypothetical protein
MSWAEEGDLKDREPGFRQPMGTVGQKETLLPKADLPGRAFVFGCPTRASSLSFLEFETVGAALEAWLG